MFRRHLTLALAILATLSPSVASAQSKIPSYDGFVLNRGYIEVRDEIRLIGVGAGNVPVFLTGWNIRNSEEHIMSGGTAFLNPPNILAGSVYRLGFGSRFHKVLNVTPRLCNVDGIPFGYAVVTFTGDMTYHPGKGTTPATVTDNITWNVNTESCPVR